MAFDSGRYSPSAISSTGVVSPGLLAAKSGLSVSPPKMSTCTRSYSRPSSASASRTLKQLGEAG
jgi:hypothetical protein